MTRETCWATRRTGPRQTYSGKYGALPAWKDETEPAGQQPVQVVVLELYGVRLVVHRLPGLPGWYCSLRDRSETLVRDRLLSNQDSLEEAKMLAIVQAIERLTQQVARYDEMIERLKQP